MNPELDKNRVARRFNRHAHSYDQHAVVQKRMARRIAGTLKQRKPEASEILEIGCGTGYLTEQLLAQYPEARLTAVDLAPEMVEAAQKRTRGNPWIRWVQGDAEDMDEPEQAYDVIVSNAAMQWFIAPEQTVEKWKRSLKPEGWLVCSTFGPDTFRELHTVYRSVEEKHRLRVSHHGLSLRSPEEWESLFRAAGFTDIQALAWREEVLYESCLDFLRSVQRIGAGYSPPVGRSAGLQRKLLQEVIHRYDREYRMGNRVVATYQPIQLSGRPAGRSVSSRKR
ncbi:malonyl-ACP O-methyltransferase BioC [Paludifilum halophilum]|uniref:malonyl-ACP O-methyltransferase BioC n=1 Tax=Paludifilum halophilum TaxID=1642702 RepID=UPI00146A5D5C|nr:malonyl-ACP O-methyltransferase BioC [Paludifilum halophilum]